MGVIGFLCISLGSNTVQLHDSLGSRRACAGSEAGFSSQNGDRACGLNTKSIHKEMFPVYGSKCCYLKRFTAGSRNSLKDVRKSQMMEGRCGGRWARNRRLLCCGFRRTGKAIGHVCQSVEDIARNKFFPPGSHTTCFTFCIHSWLIYWLSLMYIAVRQRAWINTWIVSCCSIIKI
jgi:hypothetical protein